MRGRLQQRTDTQVDEVGGPDKPDRKKQRSRRNQDDGETGAGGKRPGCLTGRDSKRGSNSTRPSAGQRVPNGQRSVLARGADDEQRYTQECKVVLEPDQAEQPSSVGQ